MNDLQKAITNMTESAVNSGQENIYRHIMDAVEPAMLKVVMRNEAGNLSSAARELGINRATLRTKLKRHGIM